MSILMTTEWEETDARISWRRTASTQSWHRVQIVKCYVLQNILQMQLQYNYKHNYKYLQTILWYTKTNLPRPVDPASSHHLPTLSTFPSRARTCPPFLFPQGCAHTQGWTGREHLSGHCTFKITPIFILRIYNHIWIVECCMEFGGFGGDI